MSFISRLITDRGRNLFLPAHGRGLALPIEISNLLSKRAGIWDLPELPDLGGTLSQNGAIAKSQEKIAQYFGVDQCWFGVNGATGLLQAALLAIARPGEAVLMPRNVHRSLVQACVLGDLIPVLFDLPFLEDRGHVFPPDNDWLSKVLKEVDLRSVNVSAAVLVHPTYHGYANDLKPLVSQLHKRGLPVLVDEAHGAHFAARVDPSLPDSALQTGADLVVHSLHKSATGLVQTSILWKQGNLVDSVAIERSISWLQTTSPSSLLIASCEAAINEWTKISGRTQLLERLDEARNLRLALRKNGLPILDNQDPLRLILLTATFGLNGIEVDEWLITQGLIGELPEPGCLTFCLGFSAHKNLENVFMRLWNKLIDNYVLKVNLQKFTPPPIPLIAIPTKKIGVAWRSLYQEVDIENSVNRIAAELVCPYPPGIPMIIPGEKLDQDRVSWLSKQSKIWPGGIKSRIKVML